MKLRFAPSPTGYLHVGNIRVALINWLFAKKNGGSLLLRIDDTDAERSRPEFAAAIEEDLRWLGIDWDERAQQSDRMARYALAAEALKASDRLYACYETPEELDIQRKQQASRGLPPVYNRAGLKLSAAERAAYEAEGRKPHWRFLLEPGEAAWEDLVRGPTRMEPTRMSDPVLIRADGVPVYTLASVVDDGELGVTHVVRGEDHVSNTAVQIQLYQALGFSVPQFAHLSLLKTREGGLSKREGGSDIRSLRDSGIFPMSINSLLARLGTSDAVEPCAEMTPLIEGFAWEKFGRAPATYDAGELVALNEKLLHSLSFEAVREMLPEGMDERLWNSVRGNLKNIEEARDWMQILMQNFKPPAPADEATRAYLSQAAGLLPPEPWDASTWDAWLAALKPASGRKGKELFLPLRLALTGREHGPELKILLPLLGRSAAISRLTHH